MSAIAVGGLVACGDDDAGGVPSPEVDSGTSSGSTSSSSSGGTGDGGDLPDTGTSGKPTAAAIAPSIYLGQTATFDGSGSTGAGLTYAWTITAPSGSAITSASLQGADTAKPTFVPDVLGDYDATLTVTSGGQTATATAKLKVVDAPVFFFSADENKAKSKLDRGGLRLTSAFGADGDAGVGVACFEQDAGQQETIGDKTSNGGQVWSDWWEAPAGQASRAVFSWRKEEGGKQAAHLFAVTSDMTCATAPTSLDVVPDAASIDGVFEVPRISPNGQRVLYIKQDVPKHVRIATVGFDGTGRHDIADRAVFSDGGTDPDGGRWAVAGGFSGGSPGPRPIWIDDTNVAWLTKDDSSHWQIVKAADADDATPSVLMKCTGAAPRSFDILPSGEVLVDQLVKDADDASADARNIVAYTVDSATKDCNPSPRNISRLVSGSGNSVAIGFVLSPDKTKVAYIATDDIGGTTRIAVAPVDGTSAPVYVGNADRLVGTAQSPRWIAGGTQVTWGLPDYQVDGGGDAGATAIAVSPVNGDAGARAIVATSAERTNTAINSTTCNIGYGVGSAVSGVGFLGLLGLGITRRRGKKQG